MDLSQLLEKYSFFHCEWARSSNVIVQGISGVQLLYPDSIVFLKNHRYWKKFLESFHAQPTTAQVGICCARNLAQSLLSDPHWPLVRERGAFFLTTENIDLAICQLSEFFYQQHLAQLGTEVDGRESGACEIGTGSWIGPQVFIGKHVKIGNGVRIHPGCVIMSNSTIDDHCVLYPNVTLYYNSQLGKNCRLHAGVVIGSDGFGYNFYQLEHHKIWHWGGVQIGNQVEIGANSVVDSGTFAQTTIGSGTKIDNLVQIAHNCQIGKGVVLCAQVGIAGSCVIGDYCILGGKAALTNDIEIGPQCQVGGFSAVTGNLPAKSVVAGHPARPLKEWLRSAAYLRKLSLKE